MKKLNLTATTLFCALFIACNIELIKKTKLALESSSKDLKNKILKIKKEATEKGVRFAAFTDSKTGSKVTNGGPALREAKVQAIGETGKFLKTIEKEALKLKETGNSDQFLGMSDLMLEVAESLEEVGITGIKTRVLEDTKSNPINTAERLLEVKVQIENQLEAIKVKQNIENKEKKNNKSKKKK
ncbi:cytochrome D ubiquinol oxidase subunit II (plasmid) [Borreliella mayonii]|uniref:Cytochrome D ubiquinol oxidase subunit II n=1 Tax=Borreliella mayonii TaxID=1674146 RepID=A0AAC9KVS2_9SPIR|nr:decorin-binding protein DbpB [Borreliella mayonii]APS99337.1 cytochrome D ubiquinol oxidase subunit II [Borreliella mayonii]APT00471.1 cytochrome D ubiquinol oxidase subunit II [Borreliella mayonii]